jgi:hypothetical protein
MTMMTHAANASTIAKLPTAFVPATVRGRRPTLLTEAETEMVAAGGSGAGVNPSLNTFCYGPLPKPEPAPSVPPGGYTP